MMIRVARRAATDEVLRFPTSILMKRLSLLSTMAMAAFNVARVK